MAKRTPRLHGNAIVRPIENRTVQNMRIRAGTLSGTEPGTATELRRTAAPPKMQGLLRTLATKLR